MKRKMFRLAICLLVIGKSSFAQQWGGSTTLDGAAYRTGNVGIGTGNYVPYKLTLGVTQQNDGIFLGTSSTPSIGLLGNTTSGAWNPITQPGDNMLLWKGSNIDQSDAGGFVIAPWSNSTSGIRITPQGSVGIGTANPGSYKLAVEGNIAAREIQVTSQIPFPDYVFGSNYKLRSLSSLEQYINQNKHLPGVPSASEVEKNGGVQLGEMNTKLLEKVEELTLYMIEMKKENEKIKKENARIKKEIKELKQMKSAHY